MDYALRIFLPNQVWHIVRNYLVQMSIGDDSPADKVLDVITPFSVMVKTVPSSNTLVT